MTQLADKLLVNGFLLTRSETMFRQLYRKYTLDLYRLALQLTNKDMHAAEDIVQEAWIRAVEKLHTFTWSSALKTWLSGIVVNCCREHHRKKYGAAIYNEMPSVAASGDVKLDIQNALALLPPGYREILVLHDLEGYKHEEISQLLGIAEGTSKSQLSQARKAMKRLLN